MFVFFSPMEEQAVRNKDNKSTPKDLTVFIIGTPFLINIYNYEYPTLVSHTKLGRKGIKLPCFESEGWCKVVKKSVSL